MPKSNNTKSSNTQNNNNENKQRNLITPRTLSGFRDYLPKEAMAKEKLIASLTKVFESFGFTPFLRSLTAKHITNSKSLKWQI